MSRRTSRRSRAARTQTGRRSRAARAQTGLKDLDAYWALEPATLYGLLKSSEAGLTDREAGDRLTRHGRNTLPSHDEHAPWRLLLSQYQNPMILILLFAAIVSFGIGEWAESGIIFVIIAGSSLLGFFQEYRASRAIQGLRDRLALKVTVLRDGTPVTVDVRNIVRGDVIHLSAGNIVPADGMIIASRDALFSEAALTGESFPVEKRAGAVAANAPVSARRNAVFQGTSVQSGTATVMIVKTGDKTEFGAIVGQLAKADPETDFERGIRQTGLLLTRIMAVIVLFIFAANLAMARPLFDSLLFSVALAVGLTPELLPAIVSVTLSAGARRMASHGVICRRLNAIANLGAVDVLCTDKTGTLTHGIVKLDAALGPDGNESERTFRLAAINARLQAGMKNPLDAAIAEAADERGTDTGDVTRVDEIAFDFQRRRLSLVVGDGARDGTHLIATKGAFDQVLACCSQMRDPSGTPLPIDTEPLRKFYADMGAKGFRVLGVASRRVPTQPRYDVSVETDMVFEGYLLFFDPLKDGIVESLRSLTDLGIAIKIISGDNRHVAGNVAQAVGLDPLRVLTGTDLADLSDEAFLDLAQTTDAFAEIDPQQKERIVRALQERGHAVAFLGDGINDAPALHVSDVGISVDNAVDVARDSADIVLMEKNIGVLRNGVVDGRKAFSNTLKYIYITISANFGNMVSMAGASLFLPFLPLLPKQILLNNLMSDLPLLAVATDNVDAEMVAHPPRWDTASITSFMIVFGALSMVFDVAIFAVLLQVFDATEALFQTSWFMLSLLTELGVVWSLRTRKPAWRSRPGRLLIVSSVIVAVLAFWVPYLGSVSTAFEFTSLPWHLVATCVALVIVYVGANELVKMWYYSREDRKRSNTVKASTQR